MIKYNLLVNSETIRLLWRASSLLGLNKKMSPNDALTICLSIVNEKIEQDMKIIEEYEKENKNEIN